jgi:hypothetical protein
VSQHHPTLHAPQAGPIGDAAPWRGVRVADQRGRLLGVLLAIAAMLLSWHIARPAKINLTLSDAALFGCLGLLAIQGKLESKPFGSLTPLWLLGLTMMMGGLMVSTLISGDPMRWLIVFAQYLFAYFFLPAILMSVSREQVWRCLVAFVVGVTISQSITLIASFFFDYHDTVDLLGPDFITATGRFGAFSGNANTNGGMIAFSLPILLFLLQRRLISLWFGYLCGAVLLWGLVASASFTAFSAAVVGLGLMVLLANPGRFFKFVLPVALLALAYITSGLPLPAPFEARVGETLATGDLNSAGTFLGRMELLKEAWKLSGGTIFLGYGADQYRQVSAHLAPVHVFPMLILVEGGLIALIGLVTLFGVLFSMVINGLRKDRFGGAMALAIFVQFMVFSMSVPHMYARLWIGPMMLVMAAIYAKSGQSAQVQMRPAVVRKRSRQ